MKHDMTLEIGDMVEGYYIIGLTSMRFTHVYSIMFAADEVRYNTAKHLICDEIQRFASAFIAGSLDIILFEFARTSAL